METRVYTNNIMNKKLYKQAHDAIIAKAQTIVGSQKAYRLLDRKVKRDLRESGRKLLLLSETDNPLKKYLDSRSTLNPGHIYLIRNKAWKGWIKVGRATNPKERLRTYQTSSPLRDYRLITKKYSINSLKAETKLLDALKLQATESRGEWVKMPIVEAEKIFSEVLHG